MFSACDLRKEAKLKHTLYFVSVLDDMTTMKPSYRKGAVTHQIL